MKKTREQFPPTSALVAFECAARLGNVTHAARELLTSPSAVSRSIAGLERRLSVHLFDRYGKGVRLTESGRRYHGSVVAALGLLQDGADAIAGSSPGPRLVVACCNDAAQLLIMPRYPALETWLGQPAEIRLQTYQRHIHELEPVPVADIVLIWRDSGPVGEDQVLVLREEAQPVCSPAYRAAHRSILEEPAAGWRDLRLLDLKQPNTGWATWPDWFATTGPLETRPRFEDYDTYTQVLEAAAAGRGVALGWKHYVDGYLDSGALVALRDGFVRFGGYYVAELTAKGRRHPLARPCLSFFEHFEASVS